MRSCLLSLVSFSGSSTFSSAVSTGIRLNDWKMKPMCSLRQRAIWRSLERAEIFAEHRDRAAGGPVHRGDQVQQGRFAGARRSHQRDELALVDLDVALFERDDLELVAHELLWSGSWFR